MELKRDTLLQGGRYRIVDSIGRGGFGITYLAEQVMAKRRVCIKEFFPKDYYKREGNTGSLTLSSEGFGEAMNKFKTKFIKEAQTIAALDHPNIIHIHDVFEENGTAYYVMDYIEGESLSELVKRNGAMSERDAVGYIKQVAAALEHIHEQQIMHLDVKPGNIMVRTKGDHAILIDFGLSKHYDAESGEATSTTPVCVSHGYAPMEQYQDGGVSTFSPETDIYSLGASLYYLVTGNVPPQATAVAEQGLPLLGALSSNIREAIERSMSYWRKDRPHTIKEFLALLDNKRPVAAVLAAESKKTKITQKPKIQPAVEQPKPKPKTYLERELEHEQKRSRWWMWTLLLLFIVMFMLLMSIKDLFSNGDNSKEVAAKEKTVYMPTNVTASAPDEPETDAPAETQASKADDGALTPSSEVEAALEVVDEKGTMSESIEIYTTYKIGDYYNKKGKKGVVFEVWDGGRHGKIVSLDQTPAPWDSRVDWDDYNYNYVNGTKTGANDEYNGKANTDKIMSRSDRKYFEAIVWCRNKGKDWYLPAVHELQTIYNNKSTINSTLAKHGGTELDGAYWSSTEYDKDAEFGAWNVIMGSGYTYGDFKDGNYSVRAVSAF